MRLYPYIVSLIVLIAVIWPVSWPLYRDSFPLSNYPMFSRKLPDPTVRLQYALGIAADGTRHHLPPKLIANEEVLQARVHLARTVARGGANELCRQIAQRLAETRAPGGAFADVVEVRIVTGTHHAVDYLRSLGHPAKRQSDEQAKRQSAGQSKKQHETIHSQCDVTAAPRIEERS